LISLKGHTEDVECVCFNRDGTRLASSGWDNSVKLWETAVGRDQPSPDLVFLAQLNDVPKRLRWHRAEAAESEAKQQWFGAAFHLRQLIAAKEPDEMRLR